MLIECTYGNNNTSMRDHISALKIQFPWCNFLGLDCFSAVRQAFAPSIAEIRAICVIFHTNALKHIQNVKLVLNDEAGVI